MSYDSMREEFEEWADSKGFRLDCRFFEKGNNYECVDTRMAFDIWQASREALMIELPKPYAVVGDYAACGGGRAVWDAEYAEKITDRMCEKTAVYDRSGLEAAGLKVKS